MADRERQPLARRLDLRRFVVVRRAAENQRVRRLGWRVSIVVLAFIGAALGLALAGSVTQSVGPVHARFSLRPSASMKGGTSVNIPPLGSLRLNTDRAPVQLNATVTDIDTHTAQRLVDDPSLISGIEGRVTRDVNKALIQLLARAVVAAVIGAAVLVFVVTRRWRAALAGVLVVVLAGLGSAGGAYATWNSNALAEPQYTGLLSRAPTMVGNVEDLVNRFGKYSAELAKLVTNLSKLYAVTSTLPIGPGNGDTISVLHVSDIHENPEAWRIISSISRQFDVDFIVDTGDLTDHGTAVESAIATGIGTLGKPYVFIKGNHDSYTTLDAVRAESNAIVLDDSTTVVDGIRIYGTPDPRFTPDMETADTNQDEKLIAQDGEQLAVRVAAAMPPKIDVVMVHDPVEGQALDGVVPLVLAGHVHKRSVTHLKQGTILFVQGSTGGAGLRALDNGPPTPVDASVLYFSRKTHTLQAYDDITIGGLGLTSVSVERHLVVPAKPSSAPSSPPSSPPAPSSWPPSSPPAAASLPASVSASVLRSPSGPSAPARSRSAPPP